MRPILARIALGIFVTTAGCTHVALERRTIKQASTLTDLQYQQVLNNLAMFSCNKEAMAWHVKLKSGVIQIADQGSGNFTADISTIAGGDTRLLPSAGIQRGILNQWDVEPAVDSDELEHLGLVYRKAISPADPELWTEMHDAICTLSLRYSLLPRIETIRRIIWRHESGQYPGKDQVPSPDTIGNYPGAAKVVDLIAALKAEDKTPFRLHQIEVLRGLLGADDDKFAKWEESAEARAKGKAPPTLPRMNINKARKLARPIDDSSETMLLILTAIHAANPTGYLPSTDVIWETERNPSLIDQAEDKIRKFEELLTEERFQLTWLSGGCKKDVPKCACYVGHACNCGKECFVWVTPDQLRFLRYYTLAVLTMAPNAGQEIPRGAAFTPSLR